MARYKMVNGERVQFTSAEETARDAEEAQAAVEKAAHDADHTWKRKAEYPSTDELIVALWEGVVEERMAAVTKLEGKRQAVKTNILSEFYRWDRANSALVFNTVSGAVDDDSTGRDAA